MQLQKQRVEVEGKQEHQSRKQHQEMMNILPGQTKQQQEELQSFQQMFTSMQIIIEAYEAYEASKKKNNNSA